MTGHFTAIGYWPRSFKHSGKLGTRREPLGKSDPVPSIKDCIVASTIHHPATSGYFIESLLGRQAQPIRLSITTPPARGVNNSGALGAACSVALTRISSVEEGS